MDKKKLWGRIEQEEDVINDVLWGREILGQVIDTMPTPAYTIYWLDDLPAPRNSKHRYRLLDVQTMRAALPNIQGKLSKMPWHDGSLRIRLDENGMALEVPKEISPIFVDKVLGKVKPFKAALGKSYTAHGTNRHYFNLADDTLAHLLIAGSTGSGKTKLLQCAVSTLAYASSPEQVQFVMVDLKSRGLAPFQNLPHVKLWTDNAEEAGQAIAWLAAEVDRRARGESPAPEPRIVLVVDEIAMLALSKVEGLFDLVLPRIALMGRELGIHIMGAAQNPSKTLLGPQLRTQFTTKVIGHLEDGPIAAWVTGRKNSGAEQLPGKGSMLLIQGGSSPLRIQAYLADVPQLVGRSIEKWQGCKAEPLTFAQPTKPTKSERKEDRMRRDAATAWPVIAAGMEWQPGRPNPTFAGKKIDVIRALVGPDADSGGGNANRAGDVIAYVETHYHELEASYAEQE